MTGGNWHNGWLIKTDSLGDTLWAKTFGGVDLDYGSSVQQTADEGYIIVGETSSFGAGDYDVLLIKTDVLGDTLWTKTFGGANADVGYSVLQTSDGGYIIVGYTESFGAGGKDIWLIRTDDYGDTLWTRTYGGSNDEEGFSLGGYIIAGYTKSFGAGEEDVWLLKVADENGDTLWTKTLGGVGSDVGKSIQQTTDGGYIITGYTNSFGAGGEDVWLIKIAPDLTNIKTKEKSLVSDYQLSQNYPNPFNPNTTIEFALSQIGFVTLKIFNILGEEVATLVSDRLSAGSYSYKWGASKLASGLYLYRLEAEGFVEIKKMILIR